MLYKEIKKQFDNYKKGMPLENEGNSYHEHQEYLKHLKASYVVNH